ncbi:hypothetical protein V6N12_017957 [Hibiscus sabdariffa]|uniref:Uncharacterized protein n=1 Tax=Hibiscus sabdariffa TaxID=183260 RepID=A0ABR1ZLG2_9ROSI
MPCMHMYTEAYQCVHNLVTAAKTVIVFSITSGANVSFFLNACFLVGILGEFHGDKAAHESKSTGEFISGLKVKAVLAGFLQISTFAQTGKFYLRKTPLETPQFPPLPSSSPFKVESSLHMRLLPELEMYVKL